MTTTMSLNRVTHLTRWAFASETELWLAARMATSAGITVTLSQAPAGSVIQLDTLPEFRKYIRETT